MVVLCPPGCAAPLRPLLANLGEFIHDVCFPLCEGVASRIFVRTVASKTSGCLHALLSRRQAEVLVRPGVEKMKLSELLRGVHIGDEFYDALHVDSDSLIKSSTREAKVFISKTPTFFFGLTGAGKSSLANAILEQVRGKPLENSQKFPVTHDSRGTVGVDFRSVKSKQWATPGFEETLIALDTQGWEMKDVRGSTKLLQQALQKAEDLNIQREVLKYRLIFVLVAHIETLKRDFSQKEFIDLVMDICKKGKNMAEGCKPVLVPVFSKADLEKETDMRSRLRAKAKLQLEKINKYVEVQEPIFASTKPGCTEGVVELMERLREISRNQLMCDGVLNQVRAIIERDCKNALKCVPSLGLHIEHMLARRHVWAAARSHRLWINGLYEAKPLLTWRDAEEICASMKRLKRKALSSCDKDPHTDPVRTHFGDAAWRDALVRKLSNYNGSSASTCAATYFSPRTSEEFDELL